MILDARSHKEPARQHELHERGPGGSKICFAHQIPSILASAGLLVIDARHVATIGIVARA